MRESTSSSVRQRGREMWNECHGDRGKGKCDRAPDPEVRWEWEQGFAADSKAKIFVPWFEVTISAVASMRTSICRRINIPECVHSVDTIYMFTVTDMLTVIRICAI